ncbi:MAG: 50S ribosome-binding GTPase, partial [Candidatus Magasanikbacteria bacterium]|nr:50S ribosome-binding GTPase [Candidatus Magasanikbacteria bacterium]
MTKKPDRPKIIAEKPEFKCGFITIVGRSNTGKSTLLNTLIGTKLAAVTHKPQTTRDVIHGVLNTGEGQAIFVDTPGVLKEKNN